MSKNPAKTNQQATLPETEEWRPVDESMLETLLIELNSEDAEQRDHALSILSEITDPHTATFMTTALQHEDPRVRLLAVARLNQI